ncbi:MAG: TetR/AcrR family transcriptional regulator [Promethearchaeota archaeon]
MPKKKRKQILSAATELFERFGYKKTTLDDIGKKVGLNRASLYYYFKSKEEIYMTIVINHFQNLIDSLYAEIEDDMVCEDKILKYFNKRHQWWFQQSGIIPQITKEVVNSFIGIGRDQKRAIEQKERVSFSNILRKCIERGQIRECDTEQVTRLIFAIPEGIKGMYRSVYNMNPVSIDESNKINNDTQMAFKIFLKGLK